MAESEDIFLRAKHRTFSGLTEGSRAPLASLSRANLQADALAAFHFDLAVT